MNILSNILKIDYTLYIINDKKINELKIKNKLFFNRSVIFYNK